MINKYPTDIETPLDRRAMTIDILAGEIARKNKSIKYWREKAEYHRDYAVKFQEDLRKVRVQRNTYQAQRNELTEEIGRWKEAQKYNELHEEHYKRKKQNGKAKVIKIMKTQRTIGGKQSEEI